MIKSILLATDGSDHSWSAWRYATEIARAYGAWLRVLSVLDTRVLHDQMAAVTGGFYPVVAEFATSAELEEKMEAEKSQLLEEIRQRSELAGVRVQTTLAQGVPAEAICSYDPRVDLVAVGHRGQRSTLDRWIMGSVAEAVVRRSCRPILVCPESVFPLDRILAAYDGSEPAKRALHVAADLATTMKLPLDVVHINHSPELGRMVLSEASAYLSAYPLNRLDTFARDGEVVDQVLATAAEQRSGLIVMGAHGHGRLREALVGSVTEKLMQRTPRPLLMTR